MPPDPATTTPPRDLGVDLVRAGALLRVVVFHATGNVAALTALPAMPLMFFLGGTFMASSCSRRPAATVVRDRVRGLVLPAAAYLGVVLGVLVVGGHPPADALRSLADALVPTGASGTADHTADWLFSTLWYLRDYVAFAAVSPILLRAVRTRPAATVTVLGLAAVGTAATGVGEVTAAHLCCWALGMSGLVPTVVERARRRTGRAPLAAAAGLLAVAGGVATVLSPPRTGPVTALVAGLGWMLGMHLARHRLDGWARRPRLRVAVHWTMARAVSIYLWQMVPVVVTFQLLGLEERSLAERPIAALVTIPAALVGTAALAGLFAPIELRARRTDRPARVEELSRSRG